LKNPENRSGAGIDAETDKLCIALKLNGKLVNRFGEKKLNGKLFREKKGDIGAVMNGGVVCLGETLKLVRVIGVPWLMTPTFARSGAVGMVVPICMGLDGTGIMRIGIGPLRIGIGPAGRLIGLIINIGRALCAATGVVDAPTSSNAVNGIKSFNRKLSLAISILLGRRMSFRSVGARFRGLLGREIHRNMRPGRNLNVP
jgi:hypothetical protein